MSNGNRSSLFKFSSILSSKYPKGRSPPSLIQSSSRVGSLKPMSTDVSLNMSQSFSSPSQVRLDAWSSPANTFNSGFVGNTSIDQPTAPKKISPWVKYSVGPLILAVAAAATITIVMTVVNTTTTTTTVTTTTTTTLTTTTSTSTSTSTTSSTSTSSTSTTTTTTTATTTTTTGGCHFGGDFVDLVEGGRKRIDQLKVGDRIWTRTIEDEKLIEDEIVLMMHTEANTSIYFYTFTTEDGQSLSLSHSHLIGIMTSNKSQSRLLRASKVTLEHFLITTNGPRRLVKIEYFLRVGFYAPLTLSGYLLVNNISTSVFTDSFAVTHHQLQFVFLPIRIYYFLMKWIFGNSSKLFATDMKHGLHPLIGLLMKNHQSIRILLALIPFDFFFYRIVNFY